MYSKSACNVKAIRSYGSIGVDQMQRRQANAEMQTASNDDNEGALEREAAQLSNAPSLSFYK